MTLKMVLRIAGGLLLAGQSLLAHAGYSATLIEISQAWGTAVADYNNDGHDDIYITGHDTNDRIWYWTRTGYKPSAQSLELPVHSDRHDCAPADVNLDGLMDFYCAVGAAKGLGTGDKELWIQRPNGRHLMVGAYVDFGAKDPYGRGRRPIFFDFNHDGYPDLFLSNLAELRDDGQPNVNRVFRNDAGTRFVEVQTAATGVFGSACVAKGDINQDGWEDLLVCSDQGPPHVYLNTAANDFQTLAPPRLSTALGGRAAQGPGAGGPQPDDIQEGDWVDAKLADMNGDGRDDLLLIERGSNSLQIWLNTGVAPYFDAPTLVDMALGGIGASLAVGDFNHDGIKDVYLVLQDPVCQNSLRDLAPDLIYEGQPGGGFNKVQLTQDFAGCGHLADVMDNGSKILLLNGGGGWRGPNYVIELK